MHNSPLKLVDTHFDSWKLNMALDEVLFRNSELLLRVYPSTTPGVIVGRFQDLGEEIDLSNCLVDHIEVVRRITGGGSVYKVAGGEYNYTVVIPLNRYPEFRDIKRSYALILGTVSCVINQLWRVESTIYPGSTDIVVNGLKISGNAQVRSKNAVLIHGTVLVKIKKDVMFKYIRMPRQKFERRGFKKQEDYVTDLFSLTGTIVPIEKFSLQLAEHLSEIFNVHFHYSEVSSFDLAAVEFLSSSKYEKAGWLYDKRTEISSLASCNI